MPAHVTVYRSRARWLRFLGVFLAQASQLAHCYAVLRAAWSTSPRPT